MEVAETAVEPVMGSNADTATDMSIDAAGDATLCARSCVSRASMSVCSECVVSSASVYPGLEVSSSRQRAAASPSVASVTGGNGVGVRLSLCLVSGVSGLVYVSVAFHVHVAKPLSIMACAAPWPDGLMVAERSRDILSPAGGPRYNLGPICRSPVHGPSSVVPFCQSSSRVFAGKSGGRLGTSSVSAQVAGTGDAPVVGGTVGASVVGEGRGSVSSSLPHPNPVRTSQSRRVRARLAFARPLEKRVLVVFSGPLYRPDGLAAELVKLGYEVVEVDKAAGGNEHDITFEPT